MEDSESEEGESEEEGGMFGVKLVGKYEENEDKTLILRHPVMT